MLGYRSQNIQKVAQKKNISRDANAVELLESGKAFIPELKYQLHFNTYSENSIMMIIFIINISLFS